MSDKSYTKVLLIESDPREEHLLQGRLTKADGSTFDIDSVSQLSMGLEHLAKGGIDVVLLDLSLPAPEEVSAVSKVHSVAPNTPIVVLVQDQDADYARAMAQGAVYCIAKQRLTNRILTHCLNHAVERSRVKSPSKSDDRFFRALLEHAPGGIVMVSPTGEVLYSSPSFKGMLGFAEKDNLGKDAFSMIHPDDAKATIDAYAKVVQKPGATATIILRVPHKDGSLRWVEATSTNHQDNPAIAGIVVNFRDITERQQAEDELKSKEEFFRQLLEHIEEGVVILGADFSLLYQSSALIRKFGTRQDNPPGQMNLNYFHPDDLTAAMKAFTDVLQAPGKSINIDLRAIVEDGSWHWFHATCINYLDDPAIKGLVVITHDMTDRKNAEEKLRASRENLKDAIDKLRRLLSELSTPVIQSWKGVLVLPLIGLVDEHRAAQTMETLLKAIVDTQSEMVILDVTGTSAADPQTINYVIKTIQCASMLGAQCVLTGVGPGVAHSALELALDTSQLMIKNDMEEGLKWALSKMGYQDIWGSGVLKPDADDTGVPLLVTESRDTQEAPGT